MKTRPVGILGWVPYLALAVVGLGVAIGAYAIVSPPAHTALTSDLSALEFQEVVDLGERAPGVIVPYRITVRNTSDRSSVRIANISSTCGCTTVAKSPVTVPPGGELELSGVISLSALQMWAATRALVFLESESGSKRRIDLEARRLDPFPGEVDADADGRAILALREQYIGLVEKVVCYVRLSDKALPGGLDAQGTSVSIELSRSSGDDGALIEAVVTMKGADGYPPYSILQEVRVRAALDAANQEDYEGGTVPPSAVDEDEPARLGESGG